MSGAGRAISSMTAPSPGARRPIPRADRLGGLGRVPPPGPARPAPAARRARPRRCRRACRSTSASASSRAPSSRCRSASCGSSPSGPGRISARWSSASPCWPSASCRPSCASARASSPGTGARWRAPRVVLFAPLLVGANLLAQQVPFNAIFLLSDPNQKWRLAANFCLYLVPFIAGALFLGTVFLKADRFFARVYFADLVGAGLGGLLFLGTLFLLPPENLVVTPILLALAGGLCWFSAAAPAARRAARRRGARGRGRPGGGGPLRPAARAGAEHAGGVGLQGRVLRPQVPGQPPRLPELLALRRHRGLRLVLPAFRAGPQRQRRLQPAAGARERLSRPLHRRRGPERHHPRPEAGGDGLFPLPAHGLPLPDRARARHVRDPVRRRHLDRRRAARRLEERHGGGIEPRHPQGLPHRPDAEALHRRRAERPARPRRRLRRAPLPRRPPGILRRRRPQPRRFRRPVGAGRLRHRREIRLHPPGDGDLHAGAEARRDPVRHAVEQGGAAEVGPQALRDDRGGRPRRRAGRGDARRARRDREQPLRGVVLPVDRDGALQARRLHPGRGREAARPHPRDVVRRRLLPRHPLRRRGHRQAARRLPQRHLLRRAVAGGRQGRDGRRHGRARGRGRRGRRRAPARPRRCCPRP